MTARYAGRCRTCGKSINPGDAIIYAGKRNSRHAACVGGSNAGTSEIPTSSSSEKSGVGHFTIDWADLKDSVVASIEKKSTPKFHVSKNGKTWAHVTQEESESFRGYSLTQAKDWAVNGYESDSLAGISDFAPPIREKRRFVHTDDGDEIDLSAAWAGDDDFMTQWTKRDAIPGIAIEFFVNLYAGVSAAVVNKYIHWIAQAIFAIEAAGIDPEISMGIHSEWNWSRAHKSGYTKVRVKREGETVDSTYWSAMVSPAAFRTFGFAAIILAADSVGCHSDMGIDSPNRTDSWDVKFDPETQTIMVMSPWDSGNFPEAEMTEKLRAAIEVLKKGN
jgi:hypothetical protein